MPTIIEKALRIGELLAFEGVISFIKRFNSIKKIFVIVLFSPFLFLLLYLYLLSSSSDFAGNRILPIDPVMEAGRIVYIEEGCIYCHTSNLRPFVQEILRYRPEFALSDFTYSMPKSEFHNSPGLWGGRRIGPDLKTAGGPYMNQMYIRNILDDAASVRPESIMPQYRYLYETQLPNSTIEKTIFLFKRFNPQTSQATIKSRLANHSRGSALEYFLLDRRGMN